MELTASTVAHVAKLASLDLQPAEAERLQHDLGRILGLVGQLNTLNLDNLPAAEGETDSPVLPPLDVATTTALRPDVPQISVSREALLSNAYEQEEGAFVVPNILA
jgi:aspartyl-tRNA(Asn)/glutamyl-tRNA(Gln) amidotransferase subunit C